MFNLANIFTSFNLISGCLAIILAVMGRIDLAPFAIFIGAFFDFFDGFIARKLNQQSEVGKQLDSLADMVTFGVAPGVIMMVLLTMDYNQFVSRPYTEVIHYDFVFHMESVLNGTWNNYIPFIALFIPFFSLFRLAKFNVDTRQVDQFLGVPTPANTLFFMTFPLILAYPQFTPQFVYDNLDTLFHPLVLCSLIIGMSLLMVLEFPLFSFKFKSFDFKTNKLRYIFLLISIVLIVLFKTLSIAIIVFLYVLISIVQQATTKNKKNEI